MKTRAKAADPRRRGVVLAGCLAALSALSAVLGLSCLSPSLPLPPPTVTSIGSLDPTKASWSITGDCVPGAIVTVFNENTGEGAVIEDRDMTGRFTLPLDASLCDLGWVKQELGSDLSAKTTFVVEELDESGPLDPSACSSAD